MTAPIAYVVDASVAAQVVSPEALTAQATTLFALLIGGKPPSMSRSCSISSVPTSSGRRNNAALVRRARLFKLCPTCWRCRWFLQPMRC
jgi:hypothetical protein